MHPPGAALALAAAAALAAAVISCSNDSAPSPPPTATATITIAAGGVAPQSIVVPRGSQVTFVNDDSRRHLMASDPHPDHTDCPEINSVGALDSGQRRQTGNLNTARTCGYHDHEDPTNQRLRGTITIQ